MSNEIRESIYMAIELIVFAALLSIIVVLGAQGRSMLVAQQKTENFASEMTVYRELATINNKEVTGDDMLLTIKKYSRLHNVCIVNDGNSDGVFDNILYLSKNIPDNDIRWKEKQIRTILGDLIYSTYNAKFLTMEDITSVNYDTFYPSCVDATDRTIVNGSTHINDEMLIFEYKN